MVAKLTPKQEIFAKEYLVDLSASEAATRAGYSPRTAKQMGYKLLQMDDVQAAIQKEMKKRAKRTDISVDKVLQELAILGFSKVSDYLEVETARVLVGYTEKGEPISDIRQFVLLKDTADIPPEKLAAISEIKQAKDGSISFKLHDKKGSLDSIGKHLGMFVEKHEHTGKDGGPIQTQSMTDEELDAKIARLAKELGYDKQ